MHIGVFGGTFNPIHYGHLRTAKRVTRTYSLDLCLLMVANSPPDKNMQYGILPSQRYEMAARAERIAKLFEHTGIRFRGASWRHKLYMIR